MGAVLAGGSSSRFGTDKALAIWEGRTLLDHAIAALMPVCTTVVVCGRGRAGALADRPSADLGPLGGLNAALRLAHDDGYAGVLSCGCDTPLLPAGLLGQLVGQGSPAYVVELPVIGYWPAALALELDVWLAGESDRSIRGWAASCRAVRINYAGLSNINRPDDLAALSRHD